MLVKNTKTKNYQITKCGWDCGENGGLINSDVRVKCRTILVNGPALPQNINNDLLLRFTQGRWRRACTKASIWKLKENLPIIFKRNRQPKCSSNCELQTVSYYLTPKMTHPSMLWHGLSCNWKEQVTEDQDKHHSTLWDAQNIQVNRERNRHCPRMVRSERVGVE
jgi:hypothetical protein